MTTSGYSGSPWLVNLGNKYVHLGMHIGKVYGIKVHNKNVLEIGEFAYVKPI